MLVPVGFGRGRTTSLGGALSTGGVLATAVVLPGGSGVDVGVFWVAHDCSSAGEIMPAPITTDRRTSFIGERPW
jgi:hypothetical protein